MLTEDRNVEGHGTGSHTTLSSPQLHSTAGKMRYIHSEETLTIPEGGAYIPRPCTLPERTLRARTMIEEEQ